MLLCCHDHASRVLCHALKSDCLHRSLQDSFRSPKPATLATACFSKAIFGKGHKAQDAATENRLVKPEAITWKPKDAGMHLLYLPFGCLPAGLCVGDAAAFDQRQVMASQCDSSSSLPGLRLVTTFGSQVLLM